MDTVRWCNGDILKLDSGDGCPTFRVLWKPLSCMLQNSYNGEFHAMWILSQLKKKVLRQCIMPHHTLGIYPASFITFLSGEKLQLLTEDLEPFMLEQMKITQKQVLKSTKRTSREINRSRARRTFRVCWSSQQPTASPPQPPRVQMHLWLGFPLPSTPSQPHPCP